MGIDAFISYASQDKLTAEAVCSWMERNGVRCWMAPRDLTPGIDYASGIVEAIHAVRLMVLVFSEHANRSDQVKREVERGVSRGLAILPLRIDDVRPSKTLEYYLSTPHWLDALTPPLEQHLDRLVIAAKAVLGRAEEPIKEPEVPLTPTYETGQRKRFGMIMAGACVVIAVVAVCWWALHGGACRRSSNGPIPPITPPDIVATQPITQSTTQPWQDEGDAIRVGDRFWLKDSVYGRFSDAQDFVRKQNSVLPADAKWRLPMKSELEEVRFLFDQKALSLNGNGRIWTGTPGGGPLTAYSVQYQEGKPFEEQRTAEAGPCQARLVRDAK